MKLFFGVISIKYNQFILAIFNHRLNYSIMIKISIQEDAFSYTVNYSHHDKIDGGFLHEYFPSPKEVIEDFLRLLENIYDGEEISDALSEGLDAMENSEKGWAAKRLLEKQKEE